MKFILVLLSLAAVSSAIPLGQNEAIRLLAAKKANDDAATEEAITLGALGMGRGLGAGMGGGLGLGGGIGGGLGGLGGGLGGLGGLGGRGSFNDFGEIGLRLNPLTGNYRTDSRLLRFSTAR